MKHAFMCFVKKFGGKLESKRTRGEKSPSIQSKDNDQKNIKKFSRKQEEFDRSKTAMTIDYIFGADISKSIDFSRIAFHHSRKTGRIKQLEDPSSGKVLFTFRPNGTIAPTVAGASILLSKKRNFRSRWVITVTNSVTDFVSKGKTVFCKHVVGVSKSLRAGEDVVIVNENKEILAVGKSVIDGFSIKEFKRGQAVKVREGAR